MKKVLVILLSMCMTICIFAGCGSNSGDDSGNATEIDTAKVAIELSEEQLEFEAEATEVLQEYIALRLMTMELGDQSKLGSQEKLGERIDELCERYSVLSKAVESLEAKAGAMESGSAQLMAYGKGSGKAGNPFVVVAYAADSTKKALDWAQEITKAYDSYPAGSQVKGLAAYLGTDCKTAYQKLQTAQSIMYNQYDNEADMWDDAADVATAIQTTCKVEMCVAGIASGGLATAKDAALAVISGVDTLVTVGANGAGIVLGENNHVAIYMNMLKDVMSPISNITGLLTFGAAGTTAADRIAYLGESLSDLIFEGKLFGGAITTQQLKTLIEAKLYNNIDEMKKDGVDVSESGEGLKPLNPDTIKEINPTVVENREKVEPLQGAETQTEPKTEPKEEPKTEPQTEPQTEPKTEPKAESGGSAVPSNFAGDYKVSEIREIQAGQSRLSSDTIHIDVSGSTIKASSANQGTIGTFDYDASTMTATCPDGANGNFTFKIKFDGEGNLLLSIFNNHDNVLYVEWDASK